MLPAVTYGILSFNRKDLLKNLLAQLIQTRIPDSEIVVVDNGSTDGTLEVLPQFVNEYTKFVLNKENTGVSKGWNSIFKNSTGKLVFIFNDDYEITNPGWEQLYLDTLSKTPAIMSFPRAWGKKDPEVYNNWVVESTGRYCHNFRLFGIPREIYDKVGGFDESFLYGFEDTVLNLSAYKLGYPLLEMNTEVVHLQHLKDAADPEVVKNKWDVQKEEIHRNNYSRNAELFYSMWPRGV